MDCSAKRSKKGLFLFILFVLLPLVIIIAPFAASVGILSQQIPKLYFFVPNMELTYDMYCIEYTDDCEPYVSGQFSEYAKITDIKEVEPYKKYFKTTIRMPEKVDNPGINTLYIGVTDVDKTARQGISVITKVRKPIRIMVLYKEKYAEFSFIAPSISENDTAIFTFEVSNYGEPRINSAYGKVDIFDNNGKKVGSVQSKETSIAPTETKTLVADWDSYGFSGGQYYAIGTLFYDGIEKNITSPFKIGKKSVELLNYTSEFEIGKISKMDMGIKSNWNGPIIDIHASVKVGNAEFKTPSTSFLPFQTANLTGYLDATNLQPGEYDVGFSIHFDENEKNVTGRINVYEPKKKLSLDLTTGLIILVVLLVLINIIMMLRGRKKKKEGPKSPGGSSGGGEQGAPVMTTNP